MVQDPDEQEPNPQDENNDDDDDNDAEDEVTEKQINLDDPTEAMVENDETIINQKPILGDIP